MRSRLIGLGVEAGLVVAVAAIALAGSSGTAIAESTSTSCAGVPGKAFVTPPEGWRNQCEMVNDTNVTGIGLDRETFVIDPGAGNFLNRDQLIANANGYAPYFTKQFLWYAPMTRIGADPNSKWSACVAS